jgi:hypothetical protein
MTVGSVYLLETTKSMHGLKSNAEKAIEQISEQEMHFCPDPESNSVAVIMKHMAGNMRSRFTDFLTSDGEKPDRNRDGEFVDELRSRREIFEHWNMGWKCLFDALDELTPDDLLRIVFIRGEEHTVIRALHRQLTHYAYHAGQIVYLCKLIRSGDFKSLSIPKNKSLDSAGKKSDT